MEKLAAQKLALRRKIVAGFILRAKQTIDATMPKQARIFHRVIIKNLLVVVQKRRIFLCCKHITDWLFFCEGIVNLG